LDVRPDEEAQRSSDKQLEVCSETDEERKSFVASRSQLTLRKSERTGSASVYESGRRLTGSAVMRTDGQLLYVFDSEVGKSKGEQNDG
jgi:hypothetical protein